MLRGVSRRDPPLAYLVLDLADARASLADERAGHAVRDEELEPEPSPGRAVAVVAAAPPVSGHPSAGSGR